MRAGFSSRVSAPAASMLSVSEVKDRLRIDHSEDDAIIGSFIDAVTDHLDNRHGYLGRAMITQTWRLTLPTAPVEDYVYLPVPPVQSVTEVKYYDADNVEQTLSSSVYRLIASDDEAMLELVEGSAWPATATRSDAFWIDYVTGYGNDSNSVPEIIRTAACQMIGTAYEHRESTSPVKISEVPMGAGFMLERFRRHL